ncbi:LysE family translocator [Novispirillum sp. DQ9]|uniref:LysE family translocator n=1 Tax=Novispirillum sp. DQ9 TaxID=3398612 RepID=UPI003C7CF57B
MPIEMLIAFALALGLAAASPGPGIVGLVAHALRRGLVRSLPFILGMVLGDVVFLGLALSGLAVIAASMGGLFLGLKLVGAAWLVVLGIKAWRAPALPITDLAGREEAGTGRRALVRFATGTALILGNPKTMLFYLAVLPTVLDLRAVTLAGAAQATGVAVIVNLGVLLSYAALAARARRMFTSARAVRRLNRAAGTAMVGAGIAVATR